MPILPEPQDLLLDLLKLIGLPALLLLPVFISAWLLSWWEAAHSFLRGWRMVRTTGGRNARRLIRQPAVRQSALLLSAAVIPAASYGYARLAVGLHRSNLSNLSTADTDHIIGTLLNYSSADGTKLPMEVFWATVGLVAALLIDAFAFGGSAVSGLLSVLLAVAGGLSALLGAFAFLGAAFAVVLRATHSTGGTSAEVVVTIIWFVLGAAFAAASYVFISCTSVILDEDA